MEEQKPQESFGKISFEMVILRALDRMNDRVSLATMAPDGKPILSHPQATHQICTEWLRDVLYPYISEEDRKQIVETDARNDISSYTKSRIALRTLMLRLHKLDVLFKEKVIPEI